MARPGAARLGAAGPGEAWRGEARKDMNQTHIHPEWKRLKEGVAPLLEVGRIFRYDELSALAGINVVTNRGRKQLQRACDEILAERNMALENVRNVGMRVIPANEHAVASRRRVRRGQRQLKRAHAVLQYTDMDALVDEQRKSHQMLQAGVAALLHAADQFGRKMTQLAERIRANELPDAKQLKAVEEMNTRWSQ